MSSTTSSSKNRNLQAAKSALGLSYSNRDTIASSSTNNKASDGNGIEEEDASQQSNITFGGISTIGSASVRSGNTTNATFKSHLKSSSHRSTTSSHAEQKSIYSGQSYDTSRTVITKHSTFTPGSKVPGLPPTLSSLPPSSIPSSHLSYTTTTTSTAAADNATTIAGRSYKSKESLSGRSASYSSRASSSTATASTNNINETRPWWYTGSLFGNTSQQQQISSSPSDNNNVDDDNSATTDLTSTIEEVGSTFSDSIMDNNNNVVSQQRGSVAPSNTVGSSQRGGNNRGDRLNNSRRSSLNSGTSAESESFVFGTNAYESKPAAVGSNIERDYDLQQQSPRTKQSLASSIQQDNNNNDYNSLMLSYNPIESSSSYSNLSSQQQGGHSITSSSNNNQLSISHNTSIQSQHKQQLVTTDANKTFIPQKFAEMRSLLSAITPLQLEAFMYEIFNTPTTTVMNNVPSHFPQGWNATTQKSKSRKFRKDAYLSEMSLNELKRYCIDKHIVGIEEVTTVDEALDLISVEFERLVFVYQNGITTPDNDVSGSSGRGEMTAIQTYNVGADESMDESYQTSTNSLTSQQSVTNLRQSLRVCSLAELRLVADKLQLDYSHVGEDKVALISMIENSMPEVMSLDDSWHSFDQQQQQDRDGYYDNPNEEENIDHDESQQKHRHRSVQFSPNCKQDTSHLIPKRGDKGGSWQSFVVGTDGVRRYNNTNDNVDYDDNEGIGYNVYEESEDVSSLSTLFRSYGKRRRGSSSRLGRSRNSQRMIQFDNHPLIQSMPNMPWKGNERKCLGFIIVLVIVVSVSVALTKDDNTSDASNWILPEGFNFDVGDDNDNDGIPSVSIQPSMFPSKMDDNTEEYPSHNAGGGSSSSSSSSTSESSSWSWFETSSSSVLDDKEDDQEEDPEEFEGAVFIALPTLKPTSSGSLEAVPSIMPSSEIPERDTTSSSPTTIETESTTSIRPTPGWFSTGSVSSIPITTNSPTAQKNDATETSPEPTNPAKYALLGPYDETNMQMVLYGISELGRMGQTQFNMLTAAYVEQFFNRAGQQGEDAIQNIVFDVVSQVEFNSQETYRQADRSSRRATYTRNNNLRALQNDGIIVTFTMTISYRTFSPSIKSDTVSQRPFYDEDIRHEYVDFLEANGAFMHMGYISQVSSIFFPGDDIPDPPRGVVSTPRPSDYPISTKPTNYPVTPAPITPTPSMRKETSEPSPSPITPAPVTPQPSMIKVTPQPSPSPTKMITAKPTPSPATLKPTPMPSKKPMPNGQTYYPTPTALMIPFPTYKPTSA